MCCAAATGARRCPNRPTSWRPPRARMRRPPSSCGSSCPTSSSCSDAGSGCEERSLSAYTARVVTDSEQMWRTFGRAAALNPAQRRRWRLVEGELGELAELAGLRASGAAAAAPVVVDLGCGSGLLLSRLARALPGARRVGVDLAESALALARSQDGGIELVQADLEAEAPPFPASLGGHATAPAAPPLLEHL